MKDTKAAGRKLDEAKLAAVRKMLARKNGASVLEIRKAARTSIRSAYRWVKLFDVVRLGVGIPVRYRLADNFRADK